MFGYPREITSDNGPQLVSNTFKDYLNQHDIKHRMVIPYWPSANGEVERFNITLGRDIKFAMRVLSLNDLLMALIDRHQCMANTHGVALAFLRLLYKILSEIVDVIILIDGQ